jgi:signal transduction histidine kinase
VIAAASGFACTVGSGGSSLVAFATAAALAAGSESAFPAAVAVTAAGVLAIETGGIVYGVGYSTLFGYLVLPLVGLLLGRNRGAYRIQAEQSVALLGQYEQLRAEQRRADVLDERTRIAREIHDVLAHSLGALSIQIQAARAVLTDQHDVDRALDVLATAQRMAADGLVETRRAVHALRVDTLPLHEEVARLTELFGQRYRVAVTFASGGVPRNLPPEAVIALLRAAQEALVNAAKHAEGRAVAVRLEYGAAEVRLNVVNDLAEGRAPGEAGSAGSSTVEGGYGLTGMRERLRLLNGSLEAGPDGGQWTVTAEVPFVPEPANTNAPASGSDASRPSKDPTDKGPTDKNPADSQPQPPSDPQSEPRPQPEIAST